MRIIRRGAGSVVTWRRAQMVLLSAQGMDVAAIAKVAFTSQDRVRDVIRNGYVRPGRGLRTGYLPRLKRSITTTTTTMSTANPSPPGAT